MSGPGVFFRGRRYEAFLFDMDGTMLDSSASVERVWRGWAGRHGIDGDALMAAVHGVRAEDTIRRFGPAGTDVAAETAGLLRDELADVAGVVPIAGIAAFVGTLPADRWAIVTSAPRALAQARLRAAGLPLPPTLVAAEDVARGKPDPQGFLLAASLLGASIAACLVFEDSVAGVEAARSAGAEVVVIGRRGGTTGLTMIDDYSGL